MCVNFICDWYASTDKNIKKIEPRKLVTWQTEIFHSIFMIIYFGLVLFFDTLAYMIPDCTGGWWICPLSGFIRICGVFTISSHSLSISVQKYIVIVNRINNNSERHKLEIVSLVLYLTLSILWSVATLLKKLSFIPTSLESCITLGEVVGQND